MKNIQIPPTLGLSIVLKDGVLTLENICAMANGDCHTGKVMLREMEAQALFDYLSELLRDHEAWETC